MFVKAVLVLCAQALLIQAVFSQCASGVNYGAGLANYGWGAPGLPVPMAATAGSGLACGAGLGYNVGFGFGSELGYGAGQGYGGLAIEVIPTSGGGLTVSSASAIAPTGLSIASENVYEGALSVAGELPFVSAVALESILPSGGAGVVNYSCGNGVTAIETIAPATAAYATAAAYAPGITVGAPGLSYGGMAGRGCGGELY